MPQTSGWPQPRPVPGEPHLVDTAEFYETEPQLTLRERIAVSILVRENEYLSEFRVRQALDNADRLIAAILKARPDGQ